MALDQLPLAYDVVSVYDVQGASMHQIFCVRRFSTHISTVPIWAQASQASSRPAFTQGATHLARSLPKCYKLKSLEMPWNDIGVDGAQHLSRVLPMCSSLTSINLCECNLQAKGATFFAETLHQVVSDAAYTIKRSRSTIRRSSRSGSRRSSRRRRRRRSARSNRRRSL